MNNLMIFIILDKSQMVKNMYCVGCENSGTCRVNYDGHFSKEKVNERTKGGQFEGRFVRNVCYNTERKIYAHSLEEARQKKKVSPINEVVDVGRDREFEEVEEQAQLSSVKAQRSSDELNLVQIWFWFWFC